MKTVLAALALAALFSVPAVAGALDTNTNDTAKIVKISDARCIKENTCKWSTKSTDKWNVAQLNDLASLASSLSTVSTATGFDGAPF